MDAISKKVKSLSTEMLKSSAVAIFKDNRPGTEIVCSAILDELLSRMAEKDFVNFCESLEA